MDVIDKIGESWKLEPGGGEELKEQAQLKILRGKLKRRKQ